MAQTMVRQCAVFGSIRLALGTGPARAWLHERGLWDLFLVARSYPAMVGVCSTRPFSIQYKSLSFMLGLERSERCSGFTQCCCVGEKSTGAETVPMVIAFSTLLKQDPFIYKTLVRD